MNNMLNFNLLNSLYVAISFTLSAVLAMIIIPRILVIAAKHSLYDDHDERKIHKGAVPRLGGISFIPCILFSVMFTMALFYMYQYGTEFAGTYPNGAEFCLFGCGVMLLYLGGVKDDLVGLRYRHKFFLQILSAILVVFSGLYINNLYGVLGIHELTPWIGIPLTIFIIVFVINAINLIDGIDGLASSLSIFALVVYGILFLLHGLWFYAVIAFSTIGVLVPFFFYNVFGNAKRGRKLFMGDSGSLTLGFILSFMALRYANYNPDLMKPVDGTIVIAVSPILIPMLDVLRVILVRIKKHKNIFKPDRNHIHHKLLNMGFRQSTALVILLLMSSGFCLMNFILLRYVNNTAIFVIDIVLWSSINMYFSHIIRKKQSHQQVAIKEDASASSQFSVA